MTSQTPQPHPFEPAPGPSTAATPPGKNIIGTIALVTAIVGFVFACIPGALIVGWILLPIAFVLSIVGLALKDKARRASIAALILSIVGTIVGIIVFVVVVGSAVDDALNNDVAAQTPAAASTHESDPAESADLEDGASTAGADAVTTPPADAAADTPDGSRENPWPLGTELMGNGWAVVINGVDLDATEAVLAENEFNDPPEDGNVYILVNLTATYTADAAEGAMPWVSVAYVSAGGNTFDVLSFDTFAVAPDPFDELATLYEGASISGNKLLQVPADGVAEGVLSVQVEMLSNTQFVAVQ